MAELRRKLETLCGGEETDTFKEAFNLWNLAKTNTGPGSGYNTKVGPDGLVAVCAYIASQNQHNDDVDASTARKVACVSGQTFQHAVATVRKVIAAHSSSHSHELDYDSLIEAYSLQLSNSALKWMDAAEDKIPTVKMTREKLGLTTIKCAVFLWVCRVMEVTDVTEKLLVQKERADQQKLQTVLKILEKNGDELADEIRVALQISQPSSSRSPSKSPSKATTRSPTRTPVKSPIKSPVKSAMKTRGQTATPSRSSTLKRAMFAPPRAGELEDDSAAYPETPTKRRRVEPPSKSTGRDSPSKTPTNDASDSTAAFRLALNGHAPASAAGTAAASESAPTTPVTPRRTKARKEAEPATPETPKMPEKPRTRFRPVFLEHRQWLSRGPKVEALWKLADAKLYGTPIAI